MKTFPNIEAILIKDYDHEIPDKPRSIEFSKAYRKIVANQVKKFGYKLLPSKGREWCECSGYVTDDKGHFVYFNSGDFRFGNRWLTDVLVRSVVNEKDYRGGRNTYCTLEDIGEIIAHIIEAQIQLAMTTRVI